MEQLESLRQLAKRAQAWLFFGFLTVVCIPSDACNASDTSSIAGQIIDTSLLPALLRGFNDELSYSDSSDDDISENEIFNVPTLGLTEALARAENVMKWELIPLLRNYEEQELLTL